MAVHTTCSITACIQVQPLCISSITCMYMYLYMYMYIIISTKSNYGVVHLHIAKLILLSLPSSPSIPHSLFFYPYPSLSLPPSLSIFLHLSQVMGEVGATLTPIIPPRVTCDLCCNGFKGHQDEIDLRGGTACMGTKYWYTLCATQHTYIHTHVAFHCVVLRCVVLHCVVLRFVALCLLCCVVLHCTTLYYM